MWQILGLVVVGFLGYLVYQYFSDTISAKRSGLNTGEIGVDEDGEGQDYVEPKTFKFSSPIPDGYQIYEDSVSLAGVQHRIESINQTFGQTGKEFEVDFEREPDNKHDPNAIKCVCSVDGKKYHIGYLPADLAKKINSRGFSDKISPRLTGLTLYPPNGNFKGKVYVNLQVLGPKGKKKEYSE